MVYHRKASLEMLQEEFEMLCAAVPVDTLATVVHELVLWTLQVSTS
jgi:hypothetical protein